jgi:hypothetical protein
LEEIFSFERASSSKECGGNGKKDTPVPMPNTVVKLLNAESSWWETACEDRKLPRETRVRRKSGSFCFPWLLYFFLCYRLIAVCFLLSYKILTFLKYFLRIGR